MITKTSIDTDLLREISESYSKLKEACPNHGLLGCAEISTDQSEIIFSDKYKKWFYDERDESEVRSQYRFAGMLEIEVKKWVR